MTVNEIMTDLKTNGSESIKTILIKHGVKEPFFGVKVAHLKTIQKKVKKDYQLAKDLFATGNADAMYLAGLIADDDKITKSDLQSWVEMALSNNINEYTVPWVAAEGKYGMETGLHWINADKPHVVAAGWSTLANTVALKPDSELDMEVLKGLMNRVADTIQSADDRVRYTMNNFVICVGSYVGPLLTDALTTANKMGAVTVDKNGTSCKVPPAVDYINKARAKNPTVKKKKTVKC